MKTTPAKKSYDVTVSVSLIPGCTADDAEIAASDLRSHSYRVEAVSAAKAEKAALDQFHGSIAIGVLEHVTITAKTSIAKS